MASYKRIRLNKSFYRKFFLFMLSECGSDFQMRAGFSGGQLWKLDPEADER